LLANVGRYLFVSSVSVYAEGIAPNADENAALSVLKDPTTEDARGENYGGLKVLCENVITETFGDRATIVRPCVIVGPRDPTNRFDYWVERIAYGGEVLAPARPDYPMEYIDARDFGEWMVRLLESNTAGIYNALGPAKLPFTLGEFFAACKGESGSDARFTWADEAFLLGQNLAPWSQIPFWATEADKAHCEMGNGRALAAGLTFRPLATTIRDTLEWVRAYPQIVNARRTAISREREAEVLREWHTTHP
jgi:2'-hydroxyisoflavone reductase